MVTVSCVMSYRDVGVRISDVCEGVRETMYFRSSRSMCDVGCKIRKKGKGEELQSLLMGKDVVFTERDDDV